MRKHPEEEMMFEQVGIGGIEVYYNENVRVLSVRIRSFTHTTLFTPVEYQIMALLLSGHAVADQAFAGVLDADFTQERVLLVRHMANIRSKLKPLGLRPFRVSLYGYILLPERMSQPEQATCKTMGQRGEQP